MPNILDVLGPIIAGQQPGGAMPGALPAEDPAQAAAGQAIGAAGFAGQQQQEEAPKIKAYDQGKGPRVQIDATQQQYQQVVQAAQNYQKIMQGFAAENFKRAQAIKQNPWANIATTIAGSMAQYDKNMPGWVRGLGASSRALNPTPQELIAQGAQYEQAGMQGMEGALGAEEKFESMRANIAYRQEMAAKATAAEKETERHHKELESANEMKRIAGEIDKAGGKYNTEVLKKNQKLLPEHVDELTEYAKGKKEEVERATTAKAAIVKSQNETKVSIERLRSETSKALPTLRTQTPEAKQKLVLQTLESITKMETKLAEDENKINMNAWTKPEEKEAAIKNLIEARGRLELVKRMASILGQQAGVPSLEEKKPKTVSEKAKERLGGIKGGGTAPGGLTWDPATSSYVTPR